MATIDVFSFLGHKATDYIELLRESAEKFKSGNHTINYKYIRNDQDERTPEGWECLCNVKPRVIMGGNHGLILNKTMEYIVNKYNVILDADMVFLYPNWDEILIKELTKTPVWGITYPDHTRYNSFPTTRMFCFDKSILDKVELQFLARRDINGKSMARSQVNKEDAAYFNVKPGVVVSYDTGWQLPIIIKKAGIKYGYLECVCLNSGIARLPIKKWLAKKYKPKSWQHTEWHYEDGIYVTHKQAGRKHALGSTHGTLWKYRIDQYTEKKFGFKLHHATDENINERIRLALHKLKLQNDYY